MARTVKQLTLEQCSKEDLLWIINRLRKSTSFAYHIDRLLIDLQCEKNEEKIAEADRLYDLAIHARQEYIALIETFHTKPLQEISMADLAKASALLDQAQKHEAAAEKIVLEIEKQWM